MEIKNKTEESENSREEKKARTKKRFDRTYAQIDLSAIRHNIEEARKNIKQGTKIMAIVKANAYGHGAVPVSHALENLVDAYGVAIFEEAAELRDSGIDKTILILGYTPESEYEDVIRYHVSQTVYTYEMAKKLSETAGRMNETAILHIKVDTGMSRIGFLPTPENVMIVKKISELPHIELEGIFTHFARADEKTIDAAREPFQKYMDFVTQLEEKGVTFPIRHVSNSASIIGFPEANLDMVRSGITTYGLYPSDQVKRDVLRLIPAMQWKSVISFLKEIEPGTSVGYGGTFTAERPMKIATIPVGYADGVKRDLSNKGQVLIRGTRVKILGRICMDQFMVDVTDIPEAEIGDEVTIFGSDGGESIPVEEIADLSHSFNYEFVCDVSERVPRKYIESGNEFI